ncbi:MAG: hypothetical protein AAGF24_10075 [Cyanobacteria bacterium P01_H01_bin.121]
MHPYQSQKIDLDCDYPCPCRRRGELKPITLTEAFGCDRCQQIFIVADHGHVLEQLSTHYPYKQAWCWTGKYWQRAYSSLRDSYLPLALGIVLVLLIVWLPLALHSSAGSHVLAWTIVSVLLAILPALMVWLAYRH